MFVCKYLEEKQFSKKHIDTITNCKIPKKGIKKAQLFLNRKGLKKSESNKFKENPIKNKEITKPNFSENKNIKTDKLLRVYNL